MDDSRQREMNSRPGGREIIRADWDVTSHSNSPVESDGKLTLLKVSHNDFSSLEARQILKVVAREI